MMKLKLAWMLSGVLVGALSLMTTIKAQTLSDAIEQGAPLELTVGVSGQVIEVLVSAGEQVQEGTLLLRLDDAPYKAEVSRTHAQLAYAQEKHQLQKESFDRQNELFEEGSLSTVELQILALDVKQTAAGLATAQAEYAVAKWHLSQSRIVAPIDGEVLATVMVGQRVNVAQGGSILVKMAIK